MCSTFDVLKEAIQRHCQESGTVAKNITRIKSYKGDSCDILVVLKSSGRLKPLPVPDNLRKIEFHTGDDEVTWEWTVCDASEIFYTLSLPRAVLLPSILQLNVDAITNAQPSGHWCFLVCDRLWSTDVTVGSAELRTLLLASSLKRVLYFEGFDARVLHPAANDILDFDSLIDQFKINSASLQCTVENRSDYISMALEEISKIHWSDRTGSYQSPEGVCVLMSSAQGEHRLQRLAREAAENVSRPPRFARLMCHPVECFDTAKDLLEKRRVEVEEAMREKVGDVSGAVDHALLRQLSIGSLKFDLMAKSPSSKVKLSKSGLKVIYNYVRVRTLLEKHSRMVEDGIYPPLCQLDYMGELDSSELHIVEELWELSWVFVDRYKTLLHEIYSSMVSASNVMNCELHKLCHFLSNMSQELSRFYNRRHILITFPNPSESQLRIMNLQILFMVRMRQIYEHAFNILEIPLIESM